MDGKKSFHEALKEKRDAALKDIEENVPATTKDPLGGSKRTYAIIHMAAMGFSKKDIAKSLGVTPARIYSILSSHSAKAEVDRIAYEFWVTDPKKQFQAMVPKAAKAVNRLLSSKAKESSQLNAAKEVFDRTWGKATQTIEHEGSAIKELLMALDKKKNIYIDLSGKDQKNDISDAEFKELDQKDDKDEMDRLLDDIL